MGAAVARLLHDRGHEVTVWNRSHDKTGPLVKAGLRAASSPAEAVVKAEVVFTMLTDDAAIEAVIYGERQGEGHEGNSTPGILTAMQPGAIHASLSTISVRLARRLANSHSERGQHFVGSPVFGRPNIAEQGKLWIVAAGADGPMTKLKPILKSISRGLTVVSAEPWQAHALKLGGNFMITAMIQTMAEAFVYARSQGIEPGLFHQTVNDALFQSKLYENYGNTMLHPPEHPGATVTLGAKDTGLLREAATKSSTRLPLADYFAGVLRRAEAAGFADDDWAVGQYRIAEMDNTAEVNSSLER